MNGDEHSRSAMRKKRGPSARARAVWAHAEWFLPALDEPFFSHSEFRDVAADMGMARVLAGGTRRGEWSRVRAMMCRAFPGGFAKPRRLSAAFLAAEVAELGMFRRDARRVLRGAALGVERDATSGVLLGGSWGVRYRCGVPRAFAVGEAVLVRNAGGVRSGLFVELVGDGGVLVRVAGAEALLSDLDVMRLGEGGPGRIGIIPHASGAPIAMRPSPEKSVRVTARSAGGVEVEVDMGLVAEAVRLLDRQEELLDELKAVNDAAEAEQAARGVICVELRIRHGQVLRALAELRSRLQVVIPAVPSVSAATATVPLLVGSGAVAGPSPKRPSTSARRIAPAGVSVSPRPQRPSLKPEHMAKNVDFRNATGAALLAKALTRAALAKLPIDSKLKVAPTAVRADVMECVSACVAVLVRARCTRDFNCIEELVEGIRVRFPRNQAALDAVHAAAKIFDSTSSDSQ